MLCARSLPRPGAELRWRWRLPRWQVRRFPTGCARAPPTSNEIRVGVTSPLTGPASAYGVIAKAMAAYADKVNAEGGINGRKLDLVVYDAAYDPNKAMDMPRKPVQEDQVLRTMATVNTNTNAAIQPYLNSKKVPQLFALSGAAAWDQPREFPWTMGFLPELPPEAQIFAQYLLETHPRGRIAVLYQDDGMGKEYMKGLRTASPARCRSWPRPHTRSRIPPSIRTRQAQGLGRRRLHRFHYAELRDHVDPVHRRPWLEAARISSRPS